MGKIILTVEGTTVGTVAGGGGLVKEKAVSETDSGRLVAAMAQRYAMPLGTVDDMKAVIGRWFDDVVAQATRDVLAIERQNAAKTAEDAVAIIQVT